MTARAALLAALLTGCVVVPDTEGAREEVPDTEGREGALVGHTPIEEVARVAGLADVCPPDRSDELCTALWAGDDAGARRLVADRLREVPDTGGDGAREVPDTGGDGAREVPDTGGDGAREVPDTGGDGAVRYYVRERIVALLVWNELTELGRVAPPAQYEARAEAVLATHYPLYPGEFGMARRPLPPLDGTSCTSDDLLVYYPGVFRTADRSELAAQRAAIADALPCLETLVVDTGNFVDPVVNAELGERTLAAAGAGRRLHLMGYSQGARNALQLLADYPDVAARTASVFAINSSAHGSEAIDVVFAAVELFLFTDAACTSLPPVGRAVCERAAVAAVPPVETLLDLAVGIGAVATDDRAGLASAAPIVALRALADALREQLAGWRSLTTYGSRDFWSARGDQLPTTPLYTSFRSVITDQRANLPLSNLALYAALAVAGGADPYNDMQVRLSNHALGGRLADHEVVMPAAEGNHWQWVMTAGQVPELLMPADMIDRVPQTALAVAYAQTLFEIGLVR
jgi:pimeloyl-ACP methyl ester carboxylesterase